MAQITAPPPAPAAPVQERPSYIAHECDPESVAPSRARTRTGSAGPGGRLVGIDAARGLALLGMMVVHILPDPTEGGGAAWVLAVGKSAALFAVVAGVGLALSSGPREDLEGRRWAGAATSLVVRALLIGALGLSLGQVVPIETAAVILPYYALLFVLAIPLLRLRSDWLAGLTLAIAVAVPLASHLWRAEYAPEGADLTNPTFGALLAEPAEMLTLLLVTGMYPALAWAAYICAGLAVGRSRLYLRSPVAGITALGIGLAAAAQAGSWLLLNVAGGRAALEPAALSSMTRAEFDNLLSVGLDGTLPPTSSWWLAVIAPHTATPFDLLFTIGVALAVLGGMILLGRAAAGLLWPLAAAGSMILTLYTAHLLLLVAPFMPEDTGAAFAVHLVVLLGFALVWRRFFARGPLEQLVRVVATGAGRMVSGSRPARPEVSDVRG